MTSQEFVIWLKGFTEGVHDFNVTPKQWDLLKEKLGQVIGDDNKFVERSYIGTPVGVGGWGTPNGTITTTPGNSSITFTTGSGLGVGVTYTTNEAPNWYSTTIAHDKTLLND